MFICLLSKTILSKELINFPVEFEDKENPPYYMTNSVKNPTDVNGIYIDMIRMLETKIPNFKVQFTRAPWARCLNDLKSNVIDAIFASSFLAERLKLGAYPMKDDKPDSDLRLDAKAYKFYVLRNSEVQWDGAKASNIALVGIQVGYSIKDDLNKMNLKVEESLNTESLFRKLQGERITAVAQLENIGDAFLNANPDFKKTIMKIDRPISTKDYYLQISYEFKSKNPEISEKIWKTLSEIRKNDLNKIMKNY